MSGLSVTEQAELKCPNAVSCGGSEVKFKVCKRSYFTHSETVTKLKKKSLAIAGKLCCTKVQKVIPPCRPVHPLECLAHW